MAMPLLEHEPRLFQQVSSQWFRGGRSGVDRVLEVAEQMRPAPLQPFQPPAHLGPVAADQRPGNRSVSRSSNTVASRVGRTRETVKRDATNVHRHDLGVPLSSASRVHVEDRLRGKLPAPFVVGGTQRVGRNVLQSVTLFCNWTVRPARHGCPRIASRHGAVRRWL